jgi:hypothetical protein
MALRVSPRQLQSVPISCLMDIQLPVLWLLTANRKGRGGSMGPAFTLCAAGKASL